MKRLSILIPLIIVIGFILSGLLVSRGTHSSKINLEGAFAGPSWEYLFGQDEEGRDLMRRVLIGSRLSLGVAMGVVGLTTIIGLSLGGAAGLKSGKLDNFFIVVTDALLAFPGMLLVIALAALQREPGMLGLILILSVLGWVGPARLVRGQVLQLKSRPFVEAARATGISELRLLMRHLLPNLAGPLVIQASFQAAGVILLESTLSFLGIGFPPDTPSWGGLMDQGIQFLLIAPHMVIFPGLALSLTVLSLNLLGDRLGDHLENRQI